ncbi:MAG TPA: crossover junction endodeoxyribonuclease RuvC, partial [Clostridiales bacterium]|nr:crossover junction endodeoxyribonuclease RuvC [Clostridiales bacterium]
MRVLGIDPGYAIVGYGVLDYNSSKFKVLDFGAVKTKAGESFPCRKPRCSRSSRRLCFP